jgi:hypothetical protein
MAQIDQLIAGSRALRAAAEAARAEAREARRRAEQARQRAEAAKRAWQEMQQPPRRTPFTLWLPPDAP